MASNDSNKFEQNSNSHHKSQIQAHSDEICEMRAPISPVGTHSKAKPWESGLSKYLEIIAEMRGRKRPVPYRQIAEFLAQTHGDKYAHSSIASFVKARGKERRVKRIHQSYLPKPDAPSNDDPIERLRRKADVKQKELNSDWDERLKINGPLSR